MIIFYIYYFLHINNYNNKCSFQLNKAIETKHVDPKSKQPKVKISSEGKKNIKK